MPIGTAGISTISDAADDALATLENNPRSISLTNTEVFGTTDSPPTSSSKTISSFLDQRLTLARSQEDVHLEKIIVLDDARNIYLDAIRTVDKPLIDSITQVNDGIQSVNDSYQARIDSGCTTDLFWRLIDAQQQVSGSTGGKADTTVVSYSYTYQCTRISPSGYPSVGTPPPPPLPSYLSSRGQPTGPGIGASVGVSTTTVEYVSDTSGTHDQVPLDSLFGFEPVNLYALKMYDEPYTADIGDTFVTSFIGTCGVGTNVVIAMTPNISGGISNIKTGQLLICDKPNVFNTDAYVITGVGTATANLSGINTLSDYDVTSETVVPKLTLDDNTLIPAFAPEDNGSYVTFTVLTDPNSFGDLSLSKSDSPYVPQTIKIMTSSDIGKGIRLEFDNSGAPAATQTWNQFLEGQTDPNAKIRGNSEKEIMQKMKDNIVREPNVGGGKIFHKIGFRVAPVIYTDGDRSKYRLAKEGETVVLRNKMGQPSPPSLGYYSSFLNSKGDSAGVVELPACSDSVQSVITTTRSTSQALIDNLSTSTIQSRLEVANMLRDDLMDINIRIWTERQLLGDAKERQGTYQNRSDLVTSFSSIIDGV